MSTFACEKIYSKSCCDLISPVVHSDWLLIVVKEPEKKTTMNGFLGYASDPKLHMLIDSQSQRTRECDKHGVRGEHQGGCTREAFRIFFFYLCIYLSTSHETRLRRC